MHYDSYAKVSFGYNIITFNNYAKRYRPFAVALEPLKGKQVLCVRGGVHLTLVK